MDAVTQNALALLVRHFREQNPSPISSPNENLSQVESSRVQIDNETSLIRLASQTLEKFAAERVASLNRERNALASIAKLPNELLSEIFIFLVKSDDEPVSCAQGALKLAAISSFWRAVALGTPALWNFISGKFTTGLRDCMIQRSRQAPLDLHVNALSNWRPDDNHSQAKTLLSSVADQSHRWRSLTLRDSDLLKQEVLSLLQQPTPLLEDLNLYPGWEDDTYDLAVSEVYRTKELPGNLFSGQAPRLRRLTLQGLYLPWTSSLYSGLTLLDLSHHESARRPTIPQLLSILASSPDLATLRFISSGISNGSSPSHADPRPPMVELPKLSELDIRGLLVSDTAFLISSIGAPALKSLVLQPLSDAAPVPVWLTLFERSPETVTAISSSAINRISNLTLRFNPRTALWEYAGTDDQETITVSLAYSGHFPTAVFGMLSETDLPALRKLTLCSMKKSDMADLKLFLGGIPALRELVLRTSKALGTLLEWLGSPQQLAGSIAPSWPCPSLQTLEIAFSRPDYFPDLLTALDNRMSGSQGATPPTALALVAIHDDGLRLDKIREEHQSKMDEVFGVGNSDILKLVESTRSVLDTADGCQCPSCFDRGFLDDDVGLGGFDVDVRTNSDEDDDIEFGSEDGSEDSDAWHPGDFYDIYYPY